MAAPNLRAETAGLVRLAERDLSALFKAVAAGANTETALRDLLPSIVETYGEAGAVAAADWYNDLRAKQEIRGAFAAVPAVVRQVGVHELIGWALATATDDASLRSLLSGGTQRRIADHVRSTVTQSSVADPGATGWQRVGDGSSCAFCRMLIGRGSVYTEAGADFASHDLCGCSATPAWSGRPRPVKPYTPSVRGTTDADRARVRDWIATH